MKVSLLFWATRLNHFSRLPATFEQCSNSKETSPQISQKKCFHPSPMIQWRLLLNIFVRGDIFVTVATSRFFHGLFFAHEATGFPRLKDIPREQTPHCHFFSSWMTRMVSLDFDFCRASGGVCVYLYIYWLLDALLLLLNSLLGAVMNISANARDGTILLLSRHVSRIFVACCGKRCVRRFVQGTMGASTCMLLILLTWFVTSPIIRRSYSCKSWSNCFTLTLGNLYESCHSHFLPTWFQRLDICFLLVTVTGAQWTIINYFSNSWINFIHFRSYTQFCFGHFRFTHFCFSCFTYFLLLHSILLSFLLHWFLLTGA